MSERSPEADIQPRCVNVAEVPIPDIQIAMTAMALWPSRPLPYRYPLATSAYRPFSAPGLNLLI